MKMKYQLLLFVVLVFSNGASAWTFNITAATGPLLWGRLRDLSGGLAYPHCTTPRSPRRLQSLPLGTSLIARTGSLTGPQPMPLQPEYLKSNAFTASISERGGSRPSLRFTFNDVRSTLKHPWTRESMALLGLSVLAPAEHELGGTAALELQLLHQVNRTGGATATIIVSVFVEERLTGGMHTIDTLLQGLPAVAVGQSGSRTTTTRAVYTRYLLPAQLDYVVYDGTASAPPCEAPVTYVLMRQPLGLASHQIAALYQALFGSDNIPSAAFTHRRNSATVGTTHIASQRQLAVPVTYYHVARAALRISPPTREAPLWSEAKIGIGALVIAASALLLAVGALVFSICRPRTHL